MRISQAESRSRVANAAFGIVQRLSRRSSGELLEFGKTLGQPGIFQAGAIGRREFVAGGIVGVIVDFVSEEIGQVYGQTGVEACVRNLRRMVVKGDGFDREVWNIPETQ